MGAKISVDSATLMNKGLELIEAHYLFDLPSFVKIKLVEANISVIKHINEDTYVMSDKYPSYRRSTHTGEIYNQNILSAIMINK